MTDETVKQLAESVGIPCELLLSQLVEAGIPVSVDTDRVTPKQKQLLLDFLKRTHGKVAPLEADQGKTVSTEPRKITLNRTRVSEIKVQLPSGRKGTVSVVRKKRHVYVKRDPASLVEETAVFEVQPILESPSPEVFPSPESLSGQNRGEVTGAEKTTTAQASDHQDGTQPTTSASVPLSSKSVESVSDKSTSSSAEKSIQSTQEKPKSKGRGRGFEEEGARAARPKPKGKLSDTQFMDWRKAKVLPTIMATESEDEEEPAAGWGHSKRPRVKPKLHDTTKLRKDLQKRHVFEKPTGPLVKEISIPELITVSELAQRMSVKVSEVIRTLMKLGVIATINQPLDQTTAALLVEETGHTPKLIKDESLEDSIHLESTGEWLPRPPVVTVMGHVDHGKTSLLDYIRRTHVAAKEAGGITQHIGAYHVKTTRGVITFLDTPGHAAFTAMRARGVRCTDIVILVVAADDGVMPQTIEAIQHARAGNVPIIVAINKIDKPEANLDRIYNDLAQHGVLLEAWGGEVMSVTVSAKEGTGVETLLESIVLQAEILELKAPATGCAKGVVIEARLDRGRGPVASVLVQSGVLCRGDVLLAGLEFGRVRAMFNELGQPISEVGPSMPVEVLGLSGAPAAGDSFIVVSDERKAKEIALQRQTKERDIRMQRQQVSKLEGLFDRIQQGEGKSLKIVIKADVQGSAEALSEALEALSTDEVKVKIIAAGVGGINESDVTLTMASNAILIGFNVRADAAARRLAENESIQLHYYGIIYDVVDGIRRAINGLLGPEFKERILGLAEVRDVFRSAKLGAIAGCMVIEGSIKRGCPIRVLRDNVVIYQGELESLRRFKEDAVEVRSGTECGIGVKSYNDVRVGDQIEVFETIQIVRGGA